MPGDGNLVRVWSLEGSEPKKPSMGQTDQVQLSDLHQPGQVNITAPTPLFLNSLDSEFNVDKTNKGNKDAGGKRGLTRARAEAQLMNWVACGMKTHFMSWAEHNNLSWNFKGHVPGRSTKKTPLSVLVRPELCGKGFRRLVPTQEEQLGLIRTIVEAGWADPREANCQAVQEAVYVGRVDILDFFVQHCRNEGSPLNLAAWRSRSSAYGWSTMLHCAAHDGRLEVAEYLIEECGMDPGVKDCRGQTPLLWVFARGVINIELAFMLVNKYRQDAFEMNDALEDRDCGAETPCQPSYTSAFSLSIKSAPMFAKEMLLLKHRVTGSRLGNTLVEFDFINLDICRLQRIPVVSDPHQASPRYSIDSVEVEHAVESHPFVNKAHVAMSRGSTQLWYVKESHLLSHNESVEEYAQSQRIRDLATSVIDRYGGGRFQNCAEGLLNRPEIGDDGSREQLQLRLIEFEIRLLLADFDTGQRKESKEGHPATQRLCDILITACPQVWKKNPPRCLFQRQLELEDNHQGWDSFVHTKNQADKTSCVELMVEHGRGELLATPVMREILDRQWHTFARSEWRWRTYALLLYYALFSLLTSLWPKNELSEMGDKIRERNPTEAHSDRFIAGMAVLIGLLYLATMSSLRWEVLEYRYIGLRQYLSYASNLNDLAMLGSILILLTTMLSMLVEDPRGFPAPQSSLMDTTLVLGPIVHVCFLLKLMEMLAVSNSAGPLVAAVRSMMRDVKSFLLFFAIFW